MSIDFQVISGNISDTDLLELARLITPRVFIRENDEQSAELWRSGDYIHLYVVGSSTRSTGARFDSERRSVEFVLPMLASPEDYSFSLQLADAIAARGERVRVDGKEIPEDELSEFAADLAHKQLAFDVEMVAEKISERKTVMICAPCRVCYLGPNCWSRFSRSERTDTISEVIKLLRRAQNIEDEGYSPVPAVVVFTKGWKDKVTVLASLKPGQKTALPAIETVELRGEGGRTVWLSPATLCERLGPSCEFLDERQLLVQAISPDQWTELVQPVSRWRLLFRGRSDVPTRPPQGDSQFQILSVSANPEKDHIDLFV